jgi:adenylate kinase
LELNVIMMGPPGAGKGTQAELFARAHGVPRISTGDILREAIRAGMPVAAGAKVEMDLGELVDDEIMISIVRGRLEQDDASRGFVLDGFPRTVGQAKALDAIMAQRASGSLVVVDVMVPHAELVQRLAGRRICGRCGTNAALGAETCERCGGAFVQRSDDDRAIVDERLRVYERATKPLVEYYRERPTFRVVDGARAPDQVADDLEAVIADAAGVAVRATRAKDWTEP